MAQAKDGSPARSTRSVSRQRAEAKAVQDVNLPGDKAEETDGSRTFEYDGVEYTVPDASEWDVGVMEGIEEGHMFVAVKSLLGPEQWNAFKSKKRTNKQFYELVSAVFGGNEDRAES